MKPILEKDIHKGQPQRSFYKDVHRYCYFVEIPLGVVFYMVKPKLVT